MRLVPGLRVYWSCADCAQIGLDQRVGVSLAGCTRNEVRLVERLGMELSDVEYFTEAKKLGITVQRAQDLIAQLQHFHLLTDEEFATKYSASTPLRRAEAAATLRTSGMMPQLRETAKVAIASLDELSCEIALSLARAGIGTIAPSRTSEPTTLIAQLRDINPQIQTKIENADEAHLCILGASRAIDPLRASKWIAREVPVLFTCVEEIDVTVGPLCIPHQSACAQCLYLYRCDANTNWPQLFLQTLHAPELHAPVSSLALSAAFATRHALEWLDFKLSTLEGYWRIGPIPHTPQYFRLAPHPSCGCNSQFG